VCPTMVKKPGSSLFSVVKREEKEKYGTQNTSPRERLG